MNKLILCVSLLCMLLVSCKTLEEVVYLQDVESNDTTLIEVKQGIVIKPNDELLIVVTSKDEEFMDLFNLRPAIRGEMLNYTVSSSGSIDFPVLGKLNVLGYTSWELSEMIKKRLIGGEYIKDPIVTVKIVNFTISVLGEVNIPGRYDVNSNVITLLQALGLAGDLTIYGRRDNVAVIREDGGKRVIYRVDLRSKELFNSPVYYLQQNDIIYVEPNKTRTKQSLLKRNALK